MKLVTNILFIVITFQLFAQETDSLKPPVFSLGRTNIDLGVNAGVQSNFLDKRGRMNHFMEVSTSFMFKGIPLTFQGRLSDEKYISGKPTYFRLSYDAAAKYRMRKAELEGEIGDLNTGIGEMNQEIYKMEGKISYLAFLLEQYKLLKDQKKLKYPIYAEGEDDAPKDRTSAG